MMSGMARSALGVGAPPPYEAEPIRERVTGYGDAGFVPKANLNKFRVLGDRSSLRKEKICIFYELLFRTTERHSGVKNLLKLAAEPLGPSDPQRQPSTAERRRDRASVPLAC
jgi:hypothetical protein